MKSILHLRGILFHSLFFLFCAGMYSCNSAEAEQPVTVTEAKDFARRLQSSIEKKEARFYDEAFDMKKFFKKAGLSDEKEARSFSSGFSKEMKLGTKLVNSMSRKGTYRLVKQYEKDKKQRLLFRLYDDGSLNYHDIELTKKGKEVKIADMFIYTSGELFSETIGNIYRQMKNMAGKKMLDPDGEWIQQVADMRRKMNSGEYDEALEIYRELPEKMKKMKIVQMIHILITSNLGDDAAYESALDEYMQLYPNEPNMHLLLIDNYILKKEYEKAMHSVNEMDKMIDKDPFLDYYRYLLYNLMGDDDNARVNIQQLVKNIPDFEDGLLEMIAVSIEDDNKTEAEKWIKEFRLHSAYDQDRLDAVLEVYGWE